MDQLYYDDMPICSKVGFPDLFITYTCNHNWYEMKIWLGTLNLKPQDIPYIISIIFKMIFDQLLSDLTKNDVCTEFLHVSFNT